MSSSRRVVITGAGLINSLGLNIEDSWSRILSSESGIESITSFNTDRSPCKIASSVSAFNPEDYISPRDIHKMDRFIHLGIAASIEAVEDSGWKPRDEIERQRTGVMIGSGIGGLGTIEQTSIDLRHNFRHLVVVVVLVW